MWVMEIRGVDLWNFIGGKELRKRAVDITIIVAVVLDRRMIATWTLVICPSVLACGDLTPYP